MIFRASLSIPLSFFFFGQASMVCEILVPCPGIEPGPPAVEAWSLNHWTARKVWAFLSKNLFDCTIIFLALLSSVQSLSCVWLFVTPWTAAHQASLSITNSLSLLKLMSIASVMPSNHLILYLLLLLPSIFPTIRVFSKESVLCIRLPKYWSFSFSISPSNSGLISFRINWFDLLAVQDSQRAFSNTIVQKHQFFGTQLSSQSNSYIHTWPPEKP